MQWKPECAGADSAVPAQMINPYDTGDSMDHLFPAIDQVRDKKAISFYAATVSHQ